MKKNPKQASGEVRQDACCHLQLWGETLDPGMTITTKGAAIDPTKEEAA